MSSCVVLGSPLAVIVSMQCLEMGSQAFDNACRPLETAQTAPEAKVDPSVYMPPELRQGAAGWYPEYGKPWENWWSPALLCLVPPHACMRMR